MCGRYHLRKQPKWVRSSAYPDDFSETRINPFLKHDRFNIAPSQLAPILRWLDGDVRGGEARWGFQPRWMAESGRIQINARCETIFEKPMFRASAKSKRCLVLATGWYEWQQVAGGKQPWVFQPEAPFAFAGLWTHGVDKHGEPEDNYLILTTEPNALAARVHNRMPVVLEMEQWNAWLDEAASKDSLAGLLKPYEGRLEAWPVSRYVNNPKNEGEKCVERVG